MNTPVVLMSNGLSHLLRCSAKRWMAKLRATFEHIRAQKLKADCLMCCNTAGAAGVHRSLYVWSTQCVNEERQDVEAGLVGDFLKAGRTGDIDLSDGITNYIKPNGEVRGAQALVR